MQSRDSLRRCSSLVSYFKMAEEILLVAWFFVVGAAIGSFLNVVVYRMPKAISLITPPSHCPACKHRIRWFDNIPIVSWLVLRGRCRDCRSAISARYPLVEAITACMFALLAAGVHLQGDQLPVREIYETGNAIFASRNNLELYANIALSLAAFMHAPGGGADRDRP